MILKESKVPEGLSVRLQVPTYVEEIKEPRLKIISSSIDGVFSPISSSHFRLWNVSCGDENCLFKRNDMSLQFRSFSDFQEVSIEFTKKLNSCTESCSGTCFFATTESKCVDDKTQRELETVLRLINISDSFESLLESYRISGSEEIIFQDIIPEMEKSLSISLVPIMYIMSTRAGGVGGIEVC